MSENKIEMEDLDMKAVEETKKEKKEKKKKDKASKEKMEPKRKKKIIRRSVLIGFAVLILAYIGISTVLAKNAKLPVGTTTVAKADIEESLSTSGTIASEISKSYFAPAEVTVHELKVALGDEVTEGQQLLVYDTDQMEYSKKKAELQAKSSSNGYAGAMFDSQENEIKNVDAANNLNNVKPMIESQKEYIDNLETYLDDAQSKEKVKLYNEQYKIQKELNSLQEEQSLAAAQGRGSSEGVLQSIEKASNGLEKVNLDLKLLEEDREMTQIERNIVKEKNKLTDLEEFEKKQETIQDSSETKILNGYEKGKLGSDHAVYKLEVEEAQKHLEEALNGVTADFNGIVTELSVVEGGPATPAAAALKLDSSDHVKVSITASKYDLEKLQTGQSAVVTVSGHTYDGKVSKINRMATKSSSGKPVVEAEIHISNPDEFIYLGVEAKVKVKTASVKDAVVVPVEIINADKEGDFCYVIENGVVAKRRIVTGISSDTQIQVLEGLKEGDEVITDLMAAAEGMAVVSINAPSQNAAVASQTEETTETGTKTAE